MFITYDNFPLILICMLTYSDGQSNWKNIKCLFDMEFYSGLALLNAMEFSGLKQSSIIYLFYIYFPYSHRRNWFAYVYHLVLNRFFNIHDYLLLKSFSDCFETHV